MHLVNTMKKNQLQHHHKYSILYRISLKIEAHIYSTQLPGLEQVIQ